MSLSGDQQIACTNAQLGKVFLAISFSWDALLRVIAGSEVGTWGDGMVRVGGDGDLEGSGDGEVGG